jgi:hypothetical protein
VCGQWNKLEMWDDGLNGRFCVDCYYTITWLTPKSFIKWAPAGQAGERPDGLTRKNHPSSGRELPLLG